MKRPFALPLWLLLRRAAYGPLELADRLRGRRDPLRPPRWLLHAAAAGSAALGERFLGHFRRLAGLRPDEAVLDVGCGVGRMALPLTRYLGPEGGYLGFDVLRPAVRWCRRRITPAFPRFRFAHADV